MTKEEVVEMVKAKVGEIGNREKPPTLMLQVEALIHVICDMASLPNANIVGSDDDVPTIDKTPEDEAATETANETEEVKDV